MSASSCPSSSRRLAAVAVPGTLSLLAALVLLPLHKAPTVHAEQPAVPEARPAFKRIDQLSADKLQAELQRMAELDLVDTGTKEAAELTKEMQEAVAKPRGRPTKAAAAKKAEALSAPLDFQTKRWAALSLTPRTNKDCRLAASEAKHLEETAAAVRRLGMVSVPAGKGRMDAPRKTRFGDLVQAYQGRSYGYPVPPLAAPALVQMLQPEGEPSRLMLVQALNVIQTTYGDRALADRALYDPSVEVRQEAVGALARRPREEIRPLLLAGLRYLWAPAAQHAAEALVELRDIDALPQLRKLLDEPDPRAPFLAGEGAKKPMVREVVRVNHMRNCLMCHAPSFDGKGPVLGRVPTPGKELPVAYYESRDQEGLFVRADITYLRQDFSVTLPVAKAAPWPDTQRYDFLVRTREATADEAAAAKTKQPSYPQREAVRFAIEHLEKTAATPAKQ
jgi:hypothetical protein